MIKIVRPNVRVASAVHNMLTLMIRTCCLCACLIGIGTGCTHPDGDHDSTHLFDRDRSGCSCTEPRSWTPLHAAAFPLSVDGKYVEADPQVVGKYLDHYIPINAQSFDGLTPLYVAVHAHNVPMVKLFLERGADPNIGADDGTTPLMMAVMTNEDVTVMLVDANADLNAVDKNGHTALFYAAAGAHPNLVRLLARHGADLNTRDRKGRDLIEQIRSVNGKLRDEDRNNMIALVRSLQEPAKKD